jgi:hypothetical protein
MNEKGSPHGISGTDLEREIRQGRKFTAEEVVGRLAGPGAMKGASAISPQQQAENAAAVWLAANLADPGGSLRVVLNRHLRASKLLLDNVDDPSVAATAYLRQILASEQRLREIVRETDAEWGRAMDERPHFEREGCPPHPDDPYTVASVRKVLDEALHQVRSTPDTDARPHMIVRPCIRR